MRKKFLLLLIAVIMSVMMLMPAAGFAEGEMFAIVNVSVIPALNSADISLKVERNASATVNDRITKLEICKEGTTIDSIDYSLFGGVAEINNTFTVNNLSKNYEYTGSYGLKIVVTCTDGNKTYTIEKKVPDFTTKDRPFVYPTLDQDTDVTKTSATLRGKVVPGRVPCTDISFYFYKKDDYANRERISGLIPDNEGNVSFTKTGLEPNTTYLYYVEATAGGMGYSNWAKSFETVIPEVAVTTQAAESITKESAVIKGTAQDLHDPKQALSELRFEYKKKGEGDGTWKSKNVPSTSATSADFQITLTDLERGVTYEYKACAKDGSYWRYGEIMSFTTAAPLVDVRTKPAVNITQHSATLKGFVEDFHSPLQLAEAFAFKFRKKGASEWSTKIIYSYTPSWKTDFEYEVTGLESGTTYEYYAQAYCGQVYIGTTRSFTTLKNPPTMSVQIGSQINMRDVHVIGFAYPGADPAATITERGFKYRKANTSDKWIQKVVSTSDTMFTTQLQNLSIGTKYEVKAYAIADGRTEESTSIEFTTKNAPIVETKDVTNVKLTSATLNGSAVKGADPAATIYQTGFFYRKKSESTWTNIEAGFGSGSVSKALSNLSAGTEYEYYAYANAAETPTGDDYITGDTKEFKTLSAPIVTTLDATNRTMYSMKLNGSAAEGASPAAVITESGFMYRKAGTSDEFTTVKISDGSNADMTYNLTGLSAGTAYEFKTYAKAENQIFEGLPVKNYTTNSEPAVTTLDATNTKMYSFDMNGSALSGVDPAAAITESGFMYRKAGTSDEFTTVKVSDGSNAKMTYTLSGIEPGTQYEFKAYAKAEDKDFFGDVKSCKTNSEPIVKVFGGSNRKMYSFTMNGSAVEGTSPAAAITEAGFYYQKKGDTDWTKVTVAAGRNMNYKLSGLDAATEYRFKTYAVAEEKTFETAVFNYETNIEPDVTTLDATNIRMYSFTMNGSALPTPPGSEGIYPSATITESGFMYRKAGSSDEFTTVKISDGFNANMTYNLTGLSANTVYEFKAYTKAEDKDFFGDVKSGKTNNSPTVTTSDATNRQMYSMTLNGIASDGVAITESGFMYRKAGTSDEFTTVKVSDGRNDNMTYNLRGLKPGTRYEFKAYSKSEGINFFGDVKSCKTNNEPIVKVIGGSNGKMYSFTMNGSAVEGTSPAAAITEAGFLYRKKGDTDWTKVTVAAGSNMTYNLSGLDAGTEYQFKTYAVAERKTFETGVLSYKTSSEPIVTTKDGSDGKMYSFTMNGSVLSETDSAVEITEYGFMYREAGTSDEFTTVKVSDGSNADMTYNLSGLYPETSYEFKSYAVAEGKTFEGDVKNYKTNSEPIIATKDGSNRKMNSFTMNGSAVEGASPAAAITEAGFSYQKKGDAEWTKVTVAAGSNMTYDLTELDAGTEYQFKIYVVAEGKTFYGNTLTFGTMRLLDIIGPAILIVLVIAIGTTIVIICKKRKK